MLILITGCASQRIPPIPARGDSRTKAVEHLDENTFLLVDKTDDSSYGYNKNNPVGVGGVNENNGPLNERRFLNALLGPNGEPTTYYRKGSCCPFKTPNGMINNGGMLDWYKVHYAGSKDTLNVYINMYDKGDLKIPFGLTARKKK